jgi:hypothetical protein
MLNHNSIVPGPGVARDPMIRVKVLVPFFMAGKLCDVGDTVSMPTTEARYAAGSIIPPRIEIL